MNLYAFWSYDHFPFVLHGEVTKMFGNGSVEVKGYGPGFAFKPIKLLPIPEGKALGKKINALREEHDFAKAEFDRYWKKKAAGLL